MNTKAPLTTYALNPIAYAVAIALLSMASGHGNAQNTPGLPSGATIVQGAKAPVINQQTMTIEQVAPRAIINWNNFNIGAGNRVEFNQQGRADWSVLNRVVGTERSVINGVLQADGQVFLLNNNGILIGKGAQINVHTFLASTLTLSDKVFNDGLLSVGSNNPSLIAGAGAFAPKGNIQIEPGAIVIAKDGGRISFIASGQVYDGDGKPLLDTSGGPIGLVENKGTLSASNGQIILAAGDRVYLRQPSGRVTREGGFTGLVVEVDSGGKVANALQGFIQSKLGNISMVGLTVNQDGRVSATTSVSRNGSVWLMARDNTNAATQSNERTPTRGGQLSLGASSQTDIFPDQTNTAETTVDASPFARSQVRLEGQTIHLQGNASQGARVIAPNAEVYIRARTDPSQDAIVPDQSAFVMDKNARIDVAGLKGTVDGDGNLTSTGGVPVSIERNSLRIELRGEQLADAPILRDSPIRSQPIYVDARVGTTLINQQTVADAKASQTQRGIFERMGTGGKVNISSTGSVVMLPGSNVQLNGGSLAYSGGTVKTSRLFDGRNFYAVATASNDRRYTSIVDALRLPEKPYTVGLSAGSLEITSRNLLLDGQITGGAVVGTYQQTSAPFRGSLTFSTINPTDPTDLGLRHSLLLGDSSTNGLGEFLTPELSNWASLLEGQFGSGAAGKTQSISTNMLATSELGAINLVTNAGIKLSAGDTLAFKAGTDLTLNSNAPISVERNIRSAAGKLSIGGNAGVTVADDVSLDVSGLWLNESRGGNKQARTEINDSDAANIKSRSLIQGGDVLFVTAPDSTQKTAPSAVVFGARTKVDTSAGVFIDSRGKVSGAKGGKFSAFSDSASPDAFLPTSLIGYGFTGGSTLSLGVSSWWFGPNAASQTQTLNLDRILGAGFSTLDLSSSTNTVFSSGYKFASKLTQYELPTTGLIGDGDTLRARAKLVELDASRAAPVSIGFSGQRVQVQSGASIDLPVGGKLSMAASFDVAVYGGLSAPSGEISLSTKNTGITLGYRPDAGIRLGDGATLDVSGVAVPNSAATLAKLGEVRAGGTVNLTAAADSGTVQFSDQAKIAINGTSATFDVAYKQGTTTRYQPTVIASDAGSLNVTSVQGGLFAGTVLAEAGGVGKANGKFTFKYDSPNVSNRVEDIPNGVVNPLLFPLSERQFVLTTSALAKPTGYSILNDWDVLVNGPRPISNANNPASVSAFAQRTSQWRISADSLRDVGSLNLDGGEVTRFDGLANLSAKESVRIGSVVFRTSADQNLTISAPYIRLGSETVARGLSSTVTNTGQVSFNAPKALDLEADFAVQGANRVALNTAGSIRFIGGKLVDGFAQGSLNVPGDLAFNASTIFPITTSQYTISALNGDVSFSRPQGAGNLGSSDVPYSAAGSLSVSARNIDQAGAIYAPFGQINLTAQQQVRFAPDSLTSVSGAGLQMPLGIVSNGADWVVGTTPLKNPSKTISVNAPTVIIEGGSAGKPARLDGSGGGDLLAYEFVKGPQGSTDLYSVAGSFAILPSYKAALAPLLIGDVSAASIERGATIRIESGIAGLPAGLYKILPASYAQLDGAFLVRPSTASGLGGAISGSEVSVSRGGVNSVIGYRAREEFGSTSQKAEWFDVLSSSQVKTLAEYTNTKASNFFADEAVSRVQDAGMVRLAAQKALDIAGSIDLSADAQAAAATQARRGTLEITGDKLRIATAPLAASSQNGTLVVSQSKLNEIAAGDLHLGATLSTDGTKLVTQASTVTVDQGVAIKAGTVILSANDGVTLNAASKVEAVGAGARKRTVEPRALDVSRANASADSSGSTVIASAQSTVLTRGGTILTSGPQLLVNSQASVSGASVVIDTTGGLSIDNTAQVLGSTDSKIGTQTILLGQAPGNTPGFVLTGNLLNALNQSASISLQGYQKIVAYGNQILGSSATQKLRLDTPTIAAGSLGSSLVLSANRVEWLRSSAGAAPTLGPVIAGTQLTVNTNGNTASDGLRIGAGDKTLDGFANVALNLGTASSAEGSRLNFEGKANLAIAGNLSAKVDQIQASLVGGDKPVRADASVNVLGDAVFTRNSGGAPTSGSEGAGGKISVTANSLSFDSIVNVPSGEVNLTSTNGNLTIGAKAELNVAGLQRSIFDQRIELSGGKVALSVENAGASLTIADGAKIDVSAANNNAGTVEIRSEGALNIGQASSFQGSSKLAQQGGALLVDARQGVNLDRIAKISADGQFDRSLDVRAKNGDLTLSQASNIKTETVVIAADNGKLDVAGNIDASSANGGKVELWQRGTGQDVLTLRDSARINVSGQTGGEVAIGSTNAIVVAGKPLITGGSADGRRAGTLTLRAPRTGAGASGTGIAISKVNTNDAIRVTGNVTTSIEGVRTYSANSSAALTTIVNATAIGTDVVAYQANAQAIINSVPLQTNGPVQVLAGIDVLGAAGINLTTSTTALNFADANIGLGSLTVRSASNLTIAGSISDGVSGTTTLGRNSWSYRLVAGADSTAANPLAVTKNQNLDSTPSASRVGVLTINANVDVRTGTGSIGLAAADQIEFKAGTGTAAASPGSVYTVGRLAGAADGYLIEPGYFGGTNVPRAQGGSVTVQAGGTVIGNDMQVSPSSWFLRQGAINPTTGNYSAVTGYMPTIGALGTTAGFNMHLGSLAGGKLTVSARATDNLYLANVSSGRMRSATPDATQFEVINQAPTSVTVGRSISGGQFMTMDGELKLTAGDSIQANSATTPTVPILFQGNTAITANARGDIAVGRPYNPTLLTNASTTPTFNTFGNASSLNVSGVGEVSVQVPEGSTTNRVINPTGSASAQTYAKITTPNWKVQSATNIRVGLGIDNRLAPSLNRRISLLAGDNVWSQLNGVSALYSSDANPDTFSILRPTTAASLPSVTDLYSPRLLPDLVNDIRQPVRIYAGSGDVAPSPLTTSASPPANPSIAFSFGQAVEVKAGRDVSQLLLLAQNGSDADETSVQAGRDIINRTQIVPSTTEQGKFVFGSNDARIEVGGPGSAVLTAGRDIRLGSLSNQGPAFSSIGNAKVASLPSTGASLVLIAGVQGQPAYSALLETYLKPAASGVSFDQSRYSTLARDALLRAGQAVDANASSTTLWNSIQALARPQRDQLARNIYFQELRAAGGPDTTGIVRTYIAPAEGTTQSALFSTSLVTFLVSKGDATANADNAWVKFQALPSVNRDEFVSTIALPKLLSDKTILATDPLVSDYGRGYKASALLFPQDGAGNIDLVYNAVRSQQGGAVQFLVPGVVCREANPALCSPTDSAFSANANTGNIRVGLPNPPTLTSDSTSSLGIIGLGGANVQGFAGRNIEVNQSRIIAGGGGELLLWSAGGNIDAGRGSKAAISVPPPIVKIDENGNVTVDLSSAIQGSGIRAVSFDAKTSAGGVSLYAPKGTVDAGDAGIVGGNVTVGARVILNAENIRTAATQDVSPSSSIAPVSLAPAAGSSSTADAANKAISSSTADPTKRVRIIVIDFEGFGVDCKETPQDESCKRPPTNVSSLTQ